MHDAAFAALGIDATYTALDVPPGELAAAVDGFRTAPSFLGANVTVPHKQAVMALLDEVDATARAIGAVNTIERRGGVGGVLVGHNTDADGFLGALDELVAGRPVERVLLLGAGGSARAVAFALVRRGAEVAVLNRSPDAAGRLATQLAEAVGTGGGRVWACEEPDAVAALRWCDLLVNATSVGMRGGPSPDASPAPGPVAAMRQDAAVMDLVYRPAVTPLLRQASEAGLPHVNGEPMLVLQGAAAFTVWTSRPAPVAVMRDALTTSLAQDG